MCESAHVHSTIRFNESKYGPAGCPRCPRAATKKATTLKRAKPHQTEGAYRRSQHTHGRRVAVAVAIAVTAANRITAQHMSHAHASHIDGERTPTARARGRRGKDEGERRGGDGGDGVRVRGGASSEQR